MNFFKIRVALQDLPHKVSRTLLVPENVNMRQLHFMIQESFGWQNVHLFEFTDQKVQKSISVRMPDPYLIDWIGPEPVEAQEVYLKQKFFEERNAKAFWYNYDFGDDWWHKITFLKVNNSDKRRYESGNYCISAEGKCPPEDVGGVHGYKEFLKVVNDFTNPECQEFREWLGMGATKVYDQQEVDLEEINESLAILVDSEFWNSEAYEWGW